MKGIRNYRESLCIVAALVLPLALAAILIPFRASFANTASALVLVAVIVGVAVVGNRTAGFLATVSATLCFDFFLTRPYEQFTITHRPDIETAVSLFVVGIVVTELAARNRHHQEIATQESEYVGLIYTVSELAISGAPAHEVLDRVRRELIGLLHLRACRYESGAPERTVMQVAHDGNVILAGNVWDVDLLGLPGPELALLVQNRGQILGRFTMKPTPGFPVSLQRRVVAVAIADQVAAALRPQLRSA